MKSNKKGFTLAELLIVVAIIAVLVAIMIPVFGSALSNAKMSANLANARALYAESVANAMTENRYENGKLTIDPEGEGWGSKIDKGYEVVVNFIAPVHAIYVGPKDNAVTNGKYFEIDTDVAVKKGAGYISTDNAGRLIIDGTKP